MARKPPVRPSLDVSRRQPAPPANPLIADGARLIGARDLPIDQLVADPDQPRRQMDPERLAELADSLKEHGVLQPLLVREDGYLDDGRTRYVVVAGGRRYAAALIAGLERLPVVVRETEGAKLRVQQLVENLQRQDLAPLDEARAFKELMDADALSAEALGKRLHITGQHVRDRLRLLADQVLADAVERGDLTPTVARAVQQLPDAQRVTLRERIAAGEHMEPAAIEQMKDENAAAGVTNMRAKGGGRARRTAPDQTPFDPADASTAKGGAPPASTQGVTVTPRQKVGRDIMLTMGLFISDLESLTSRTTSLEDNRASMFLEYEIKSVIGSLEKSLAVVKAARLERQARRASGAAPPAAVADEPQETP